MLDPAIPIAMAVCGEDGLIADVQPVCVLAPACDGSQIADRVDSAIGPGTCTAGMDDGAECLAECPTGYTSLGGLTCTAGELVGANVCAPPGSSLKVETVEMVASTLRLNMDLSRTAIEVAQESVGASLSAALGIPKSDMTSVIITYAGARRLLGERLLQSVPAYDCAYSFVLRASTGISMADMTLLASSLGSEGSPVQSSFINALSAKNIQAFGVSVIVPPRSFTTTVVTDADGKVMAPAPPPFQMPTDPPRTTTATPSPTPVIDMLGGSENPANKKESDDMSGIVGGFLGGMVALVFIGGVAYYFVAIKRKERE
eukprot:gnl/TRDRNA2_/TRDRNA2_87490_c2_seq1.p1 gnl/TRDRNA2_/TRDRNA2_87490_c2~~gnl/TRDRNA2_/TRDRNA2_87490_c2_seq1.p1  ORF type:complete len:345 (-),score=35.39 gnl/TRDRNA2_/TRDRNA2_87490_c2_seq1:56-1003(-)